MYVRGGASEEGLQHRAQLHHSICEWDHGNKEQTKASALPLYDNNSVPMQGGLRDRNQKAGSKHQLWFDWAVEAADLRLHR